MRGIVFIRMVSSATLLIPGTSSMLTRKNLIIDTDLFSDVDDTAAILLAATSPHVNLLAVNINYPSTYSALAASAILSHYGQSNVPIGIKRPLTNESFFDDFTFELGEYASKIAYHYSGGSLPWGSAEEAADPVSLYRRVLSEAANDSVTVASIGFLDNLSGLLNSTGDEYSDLSGPELVEQKVSELVIMGGGYPSGYEFNFFSSPLTAHVVNNWKGSVVFSGSELGGNVSSGSLMIAEGPKNDPVRQAYIYYTHGVPRPSWDPLTVLYSMVGLGDLFEYGNDYGYNHIFPNGSNTWIYDQSITDQHFLKLKVDNATAAARLDLLLLHGVQKPVNYGNKTEI